MKYSPDTQVLEYVEDILMKESTDNDIGRFRYNHCCRVGHLCMELYQSKMKELDIGSPSSMPGYLLIFYMGLFHDVHKYIETNEKSHGQLGAEEFLKCFKGKIPLLKNRIQDIAIAITLHSEKNVTNESNEYLNILMDADMLDKISDKFISDLKSVFYPGIETVELIIKENNKILKYKPRTTGFIDIYYSRLSAINAQLVSKGLSPVIIPNVRYLSNPIRLDAMETTSDEPLEGPVVEKIIKASSELPSPVLMDAEIEERHRSFMMHFLTEGMELAIPKICNVQGRRGLVFNKSVSDDDVVRFITRHFCNDFCAEIGIKDHISEGIFIKSFESDVNVYKATLSPQWCFIFKEHNAYDTEWYIIFFNWYFHLLSIILYVSKDDMHYFLESSYKTFKRFHGLKNSNFEELKVPDYDTFVIKCTEYQVQLSNPISYEK